MWIACCLLIAVVASGKRVPDYQHEATRVDRPPEDVQVIPDVRVEAVHPFRVAPFLRG